MTVQPPTCYIDWPWSTTYDDNRHNFNKWFNVFPRAIVYCQTNADVAGAIAWARSMNASISVRSGGHSYTGFSLCDGVVIDLSRMNTVSVGPNAQTATAGPGTPLLSFYTKLAEYDVTVPAGSCGSVGLGGLALGGGFGLFSRKLGLTCDSLLSVDMVNADGQVITANRDLGEHADLLWACQGGGGSFGVVTSMTFQTHPVGNVVVFDIQWPLALAAGLLGTWQSIAPRWPDEITSLLRITGTPNGSVSCKGVFMGDETVLRALLQPILGVGQPSKPPYIQTMPFLEAVKYFADDTMEPMWKAKSDYALRPLSAIAIRTIVQYMANSPNPDDFIQFDNYGGAVNRVPADATAFPHREGTLFSLQYLSVWNDDAQTQVSLEWIRAFYAAMRPYVSGFSYANYCDLDLETWTGAYYGLNLPALVAVKKKYDPENVFNFAQSIPTT